eukprot:1158116-Pelagomonas_calceolata.AAC.5
MGQLAIPVHQPEVLERWGVPFRENWARGPIGHSCPSARGLRTLEFGLQGKLGPWASPVYETEP